MKALMLCAAVSAGLAAPAAAEIRYDRKLEEAVKEIVARKIGDIRGGFAYNAKPAFVIAQDPLMTGSVAQGTVPQSTEAPVPAGLVPATERGNPRAVTF